MYYSTSCVGPVASCYKGTTINSCTLALILSSCIEVYPLPLNDAFLILLRLIACKYIHTQHLLQSNTQKKSHMLLSGICVCCVCRTLCAAAALTILFLSASTQRPRRRAGCAYRSCSEHNVRLFISNRF